MGYNGPGVCVEPANPCGPISPGWVTEDCDAANQVVFTGQGCVETCPGCCGCEPFCELTFPDLAACQASCGGVACAAWNGVCDDGLPEKPWWAWDGSACGQVDSCQGLGAPGTFATEADCHLACQPKECELWNGACFDAEPTAPWWWFNPASGLCEMEAGCTPFFPGVYESQGACQAACLAIQ
jgi:hypothetical protein